MNKIYKILDLIDRNTNLSHRTIIAETEAEKELISLVKQKYLTYSRKKVGENFFGDYRYKITMKGKKLLKKSAELGLS